MDEKGSGGNWFNRTFGPAGPMVSAVIWITVLALAIWMIGFINSFIYTAGLAQFRTFLLSNLAYFSAILLFFSYAPYIAGRSKKAFMVIAPLAVAAGVLTVLWLLWSGLDIAKTELGNELIDMAADFIGAYMFVTFWLLLLLGYVAVALKAAMKGSLVGSEEEAPGEGDDLGKRRDEIKQMMKVTEKKYFERKIDKNTLKETMQEYQQQLTELEVKLKKGRG